MKTLEDTSLLWVETFLKLKISHRYNGRSINAFVEFYIECGLKYKDGKWVLGSKCGLHSKRDTERTTRGYSSLQTGYGLADMSGFISNPLQRSGKIQGYRFMSVTFLESSLIHCVYVCVYITRMANRIGVRIIHQCAIVWFVSQHLVINTQNNQGFLHNTKYPD